MNTILLRTDNWDLTVDFSRNIAMASEPYSFAQDAASAIRLFQGELWYNTARGIPYWLQILGKRPPLALLKAKLVAAALTVPGVVSATAFISSFVNRRLTGQVQIKAASGATAVASF